MRRVYLKLCQNIRLVPLSYAESLVAELLAGELEEDIVQGRADNLLHRLILDKFFKFLISATRDDFTLVENNDTVAELLDFFHVVRSVDNGGAVLAEGFDIIEDMLATLRIDGNGRFVKEDEFWFMGDTASDIEAAEKAAGKLFWVELAEIFQTDEFDCVIDTLFAFGLIFDIEAAEKVDVIFSAEFFKNGDVLENNTDLTL